MMQRSRAVLLVGPLPPPSGGISTHVDDLEGLLQRREIEVRRLHLRPGAARSPSALLRLAEALAAAAAGGAVVHVHANGHNAGSWRLCALVAAAAPGGRAVLTLHSGLAPRFIADHPRSCSLVARRFARVLCVSEAVAGALRAAGVDEERTLVAPAFVISSLPLPRAPAGLRAPVSGGAAPLLGAALAQGEEYGARLLLEGLVRLRRQLPRVRLVVFGPAARAPALDEEARARGLAEALLRYGDLPRAEALGVLSAVDLFVRPTLADGDALSVREARALGKRVLASDAAVRPGGCQIFRAGDPAALAHGALAALAAPPPPPLRSDGTEAILAAWRVAGLRLESIPEVAVSVDEAPAAAVLVASPAAFGGPPHERTEATTAAPVVLPTVLPPVTEAL